MNLLISLTIFILILQICHQDLPHYFTTTYNIWSQFLIKKNKI